MKKWKSNILAIALILSILLCAVFVWPNFYETYRLEHNVPITDTTNEEAQIIKENIDFVLPDDTIMCSVDYDPSGQDSTFVLLFTIPKDSSVAFIDSISSTYIINPYTSYSETDNIEIEGAQYAPIHEYWSNKRIFTVIWEYEVTNDISYFQLYYKHPPSNITDIFYRRIQIFPFH